MQVVTLLDCRLSLQKLFGPCAATTDVTQMDGANSATPTEAAASHQEAIQATAEPQQQQQQQTENGTGGDDNDSSGDEGTPNGAAGGSAGGKKKKSAWLNRCSRCCCWNVLGSFIKWWL